MKTNPLWIRIACLITGLVAVIASTTATEPGWKSHCYNNYKIKFDIPAHWISKLSNMGFGLTQIMWQSPDKTLQFTLFVGSPETKRHPRYILKEFAKFANVMYVDNKVQDTTINGMEACSIKGKNNTTQLPVMIDVAVRYDYYFVAVGKADNADTFNKHANLFKSIANTLTTMIK